MTQFLVKFPECQSVFKFSRYCFICVYCQIIFKSFSMLLKMRIYFLIFMTVCIRYLQNVHLLRILSYVLYYFSDTVLQSIAAKTDLKIKTLLEFTDMLSFVYWLFCFSDCFELEYTVSTTGKV